MTWKIGDKAVCVKKGEWVNSSSQPNAKHPAYDEIVCVNYVNNLGDRFFIGLTGYSDLLCFEADYFRKIHDAKTGTVAVKKKKQVSILSILTERVAKKMAKDLGKELGSMPPPSTECDGFDSEPGF